MKVVLLSQFEVRLYIYNNRKRTKCYFSHFTIENAWKTRLFKICVVFNRKIWDS